MFTLAPAPPVLDSEKDSQIGDAAMATSNGYRRGGLALVIAVTLASGGCQTPLVVPGGSTPPQAGSAATGTHAPRIIRFAFDPPQVPEGSSSRLTWQTQYADSVHITELGVVPSNGSRVFVPTPGLVYRITATNPNGSADAQITGSVGYAPQIYDPGPSGSGSVGTNPVGPPIIGPLPDGPGGTVGPNPVGPPIRPPVERDMRQTLPDNRLQLQQQQLERLQRMQDMQPLRP